MLHFWKRNWQSYKITQMFFIKIVLNHGQTQINLFISYYNTLSCVNTFKASNLSKSKTTKLEMTNKFY